MGEESTRRNKVIDDLRGIAIFLVILGHAIIKYPIDITQIRWYSILREVIYSFHMPLFFCISGYVYSCKDYKSYLIKKIERILYPYFLFGIMSVIIHCISTDFVSETKSFGDEIVRLLLYGGEYWFLYTLFIVFLVFPLINKYLKSKISYAIILGGLLIIQQILTLPYDGLFTIGAVVYYLPYFIIGTYFKKKKVCFENNRNTASIIICMLLYILSFGLIKTMSYELKILVYIRSLSMIYILVFFCAVCIERQKGRRWISRFLDRCSLYSLQLYLTNGYFLALTRYLLCIVLKVTNPIIIILVITSSSIIGGLTTCFIAEKSEILSKLIGIKR